jgi:hypothetical protein
MSEIQANKLSPSSGTALQIGDASDVITIPSGATITNSGTATGFGESNTPSFSVYKTGTTSLSNNATTLLIPTTVARNDDTVYNTSNGKFTVPSGQGGLYFLFGSFRISGYTPNRCQALFFVNGSEVNYTLGESVPDGSVSNIHATIPTTALLELSASDYVELRGSQASGSTNNIFNTVFGGFKIR